MIVEDLVVYAKAFVGTLVAFLAIDMIWIARVARPMYERQVGDLLRAIQSM